MIIQNNEKQHISRRSFRAWQKLSIWSGNHRSFLGYTCHWLTEKLERKSVALACKRLPGVHSAEKLAQVISEIQSSFGLNSSNVVMTVTDNGSNFVKAFKEYGVAHDVDEDDSDGDLPTFDNECLLPKHQRCASHTLNLLATTDYLKVLKTEPTILFQHNMTLEKCNNLWKKSKWPKSSEIIVSSLGSSLLVPVVTRWNSLFDAFSRLLRHKADLNDLCHKLSLPHFSSGDFQYLESYQLIMEPIASALDFLQGEQEVKYGSLIPTLITLSNKLYKVSKRKELLHLSSILIKLEQELRKRFRAYFTLAPEANIAIVATVLTPGVKTKWIKVLQKSWPELTEELISSSANE